MRTRITITVDEETLREAEARVAAGEARSLSAWVAEAMRASAKRESLDDLLDEIIAEVGPPSEEDEQWVRDVLAL
jgi:methanogenic corrinoid protein MtbC1